MIGKWELQVEGETLEEIHALCAQLEGLPGVTAASPDRVIELVPQALPSDAQNLAWAQIDRLPEAWEAYSAQVTTPASIGMVDTGVRAAHEELAGVMNPITEVKNASYPQVPANHGTAVAGVMAAKAGNGKGGAGVAWNAQVASVCVIDSAGKSLSMVMIFDAIAEEIAQGANAVNMSLGVLSDTNPNGLTGEAIADSAKETATFMKALLDYGYEDFVITQSAGNYAADAIANGVFASVTPENCGLEPAAAQEVCDRILIVGALQQSGNLYELWGSSATGGQVSLCAPGVGITLPTAVSDSSYATFSGTSVAAPQVAATAAWMMAANQGLDGGEVGRLLKSAEISPLAVRPNGGNTAQYRMLDVKRAMDAAMGGSVPATYTVTLDPNNGSAALSSITVTSGGSYSALPTPKRDGFLFEGWYTDLSGGSRVNPTDIVELTGDITLYARWGAAPTYALTVVKGSGSGSHAAGAVVPITADTAPAGQVFDKWTVSGSGSVANANSASTTFTMGAGAATVTATYKPAGGGGTPTPEKYIKLWSKETKYKDNFGNWLLVIFLFGWLWMAF
jgi:uncharacterized repeat protein (TIGR02543 family)